MKRNCKIKVNDKSVINGVPMVTTCVLLQIRGS